MTDAADRVSAASERKEPAAGVQVDVAHVDRDRLVILYVVEFSRPEHLEVSVLEQLVLEEVEVRVEGLVGGESAEFDVEDLVEVTGLVVIASDSEGSAALSATCPST